MEKISHKFGVNTLHCLPGLEVVEAQRSSFQFALRVRPEYTIALVTEGAERFTYRGRIITAPVGSLILINPDEAHDGRAAERERSYWAIYPSPALLLALLPQTARPLWPPFREPFVQDRCLARKFASFIRSALSTHSPQVLRQMFVEFMIEALTKYASDSLSSARLPDSWAAVRYARNRLMSSPEQIVPLGQLAEETAMSPLALLRSFQHCLGCTPHAFQIGQRLRLAKELLRSGEPISHAAVASGFFDQSHLTNTLRRWTGLTPAQYLQSIRLA